MSREGLTTCVGVLNLRIPKLGTDGFFPDDVIERYQRVDRTIGCDERGWRRVLGIAVVYAKSYDSWLAFLRRIRARGVTGVHLVTSNAHEGIRRAVGEAFLSGNPSWYRVSAQLVPRVR